MNVIQKATQPKSIKFPGEDLCLMSPLQGGDKLLRSSSPENQYFSKAFKEEVVCNFSFSSEHF